MGNTANCIITLVLLSCCMQTQGLIEDLNLKRERRQHVPISTFGLSKDGHITVKFGEVKFHGQVAALGFSVQRSRERVVEYDLDIETLNECFLTSEKKNLDIVRHLIDMETGLFIESDEKLAGVTITTRRLYDIEGYKEDELWQEMDIVIDAQGVADMYTVSVHFCNKSPTEVGSYDMKLHVDEMNLGPDYLGAGLAPVPGVYFFMAGLFALASVAWGLVLYSSRNSRTLYKVHYLMLALVIVKTLSLIFHGIDYNIIKNKGTREEGWAVTYYIINLAKGLMLFLTVLLIGAGYGFVKHALSKNERNVFLIVLPLQVFSNIAYIIIEESAEGSATRNTWRSIGLLVDLLCCSAILFPLVWSIRHLREAAESDGKAAASLVKLRLFRKFYVMVLAYVYTTRIVVYLLFSTVPFQFEWVGALFNEVVNFIFYVTTAYMFSPEEDNDFLHVPSSDEEDSGDDDESTVFLAKNVSDGFKRVKPSGSSSTDGPTSRAGKHKRDLLEPDF